jgi:Na+-transporting methylmalonyl-CoA/oxaloacetate decarboxylase gamma subunit
MFVGMAVVFLFLVILVLTVVVISKILARILPEEAEGPALVLAPAGGGEAEIALAIAAVKAFVKS